MRCVEPYASAGPASPYPSISINPVSGLSFHPTNSPQLTPHRGSLRLGYFSAEVVSSGDVSNGRGVPGPNGTAPCAGVIVNQ